MAEWNWNYGNRILVLPAGVLNAQTDDVGLRVLLWLSSDLTLAQKPTQLAKLAECTKPAAEKAIRFWKEQGVLTVSEDREDAKPTEKKPETKKTSGKLRRADEIPTYTATELAGMMEKKASLRALVDESQKILGKMFSTYEVNILLGLVDYLQLEEDYILLLLAHCRRVDVTGMRMIERYAINLVDQGVRNATDLEERVRQIEQAYTLEGQIRAIYGIRSRSLTSKEKKMIGTWSDYGYTEEIIRRAYEITVDSTGDASLSYTNAILERWHAEGLNTVDEIDRKLEEERAEKEGKKDGKVLGNSFDTDDFFAAALQRSFRKDEDKKDT